MKFCTETSDSSRPNRWLSLFTSMFLHGSLWHLLGNMFFLWMFGDNVEDVLGSFGFLAVYLISGIAAGGAHLALNAGSDVPAIGASGAISGIVGIYLAFFPKLPTDLVFYLFWWEVETFQVTTLGAVGAWFGEQLLLGLLTTATGLDEYVSIAFWAHIGGLLAGVLLGSMLVALGYVRRYAAATGSRNPLVGYVRVAAQSDHRVPKDRGEGALPTASETSDDPETFPVSQGPPEPGPR